MNPVLPGTAPFNDLERNVYCIFGLPIDALNLSATLGRIEAAAGARARFLISTPNLNFLVNSRSDSEFRETVLGSDLCPPDGMPVVWIARLLGVPIEQRVSGSDIFEALKVSGPPLKLFLFGGEKDVAATAARRLNAVPSQVTCVGTLDPGFGTVEEMSDDRIIDFVNASGADFLAASLGARKGQLWLYRNHERLTVPVRAHLGAVINFQAGRVKRAPTWFRMCGLEWLWRIKEEPHLWQRYAHDGAILLRLLSMRALPLAMLNRWCALKSKWRPKELLIRTEHHHDHVTIKLSGDANQRSIAKAIGCFQETLTNGYTDVVVDLASVHVIDGRFLGLLLMVRKCLKGKGATLRLVGVLPSIRRLFRLNEVNFLLNGAIEAT